MRRTLLVILFSSLFLLSDRAGAQTPGLVAAYSFNEGGGTTVADDSGNGNTGTLAGATWTATGKYGNALSFNGSTSYVDLGNPASLQLTGSATWMAWINAAANPGDDGQIIAKSDGSGWQFKTSPDTGPHTFGVGVSGSSSTLTQRYSTSSRALNTWYHVAGVYNASVGSLSIYVNGVLNNGTIVGTIPALQFNSAVNVNIGRRTGGFYFNGVIDEVRVYNRALTQAEIQSDMNTPIGAAPPTALSACDLNSDSTVNVSDVQMSVNMALGMTPCTANVYSPGVCNVVVVQRVVTSALGGDCVTGTGLPAISSLSCAPTTLSSGGTSTCTLTLASPATSNTAVALSSNNANLTVPVSVTVQSGLAAVAFTATAGTVSANGSAIVTATLDGISSTAPITLNGPVPAPTLSSLACAPSTLASGASSTCTVTLTAVASSNTVVSVADNHASLTVPASVMVLSGQSTATFTATAGTITATSSATVTATLAAASRTATLTLNAATVSHSVTLSWTASTSPNVIGYNIYRGIASGGPYTKLTSSPVNALSYVDGTVLGGTTYYYVGTAVNSSSLESVYSTQTQSIVPSP